jgi:hypothetical protein
MIAVFIIFFSLLILYQYFFPNTNTNSVEGMSIKKEINKLKNGVTKLTKVFKPIIKLADENKIFD